MFKWIIHGKGHANISATHKSTIEFTKENFVTERGTCIVAVSCNKGLEDIPKKIKQHLLKGGRIRIIIKCKNISETIYAQGSENLILSHPEEMVIRKSSFIDARTLAIRANKAACDIKREVVKRLKNPLNKVKIIIEGPVV